MLRIDSTVCLDRQAFPGQGILVLDEEVAFEAADETVGHAGVEGADNQIELREGQRQFVELLADAAFLVRGCVEPVVHLAAGGFADLVIAAEAEGSAGFSSPSV